MILVRRSRIDRLVSQAEKVLDELRHAADAWKQAAHSSGAASKRLTETVERSDDDT